MRRRKWTSRISSIDKSYTIYIKQSVPATYDPNGTVLRSLIRDIIDLYETNRKECAKLLLELPLWVVTGTFKSKSEEDDGDDDDRKDWVLENLIVEVGSFSLGFLDSVN